MLLRVFRFLPAYVWAILFAATLVGSFYTGWKVKAWRTDAQNLKILEALNKEIDKGNTIQKELDRSLAQAKQEKEVVIRKVYRTIYKEIDRVTTNTACFTNDAAELYNRALAGNGGKTNPSGATSETSRADTSNTEKR